MNYLTAASRPYQLLVRSITNCAIYMLDDDGTVTSWNSGAERARGYRVAEIIGCHFSCFYGPEEQAASIPSMNLDVARATGKFDDQAWRYRQDGSRFWALVTIDTLYHEGQFVVFAKTTRDGTFQREQRITLEAMAANLRLA